MFQQENTPCHRAMAVLERFENNARRKMLFPPQSSYVSPIKKYLEWHEKGRINS